jgi:DNA-binding response OmpR family regulator
MKVLWGETPRSKGNSVSLKILLADDSLTAQNMGKKILAEAGYEVIAVSNGAQAMKKIAADIPDLAVLDVYMPGYSGVEVCERIRSSRETAAIPVILSVGKMEAFKPEEGSRVRADGLIVKPFEATELLAVVKKLVNSASPAKRPQRPPEPEIEPEEGAKSAATEFCDVPPEFEVQHQSVDVPKEVASIPVIGMDLIPEEPQQSGPSSEFELERFPEPVQVDASLRMAAADGLSGVFELEEPKAPAEKPSTAAEASGDNDSPAAAHDLMNGPNAYDHGAASEPVVEETSPPVMEPITGAKPELLEAKSNESSLETEAQNPGVLPELTSWDDQIAPPMLEMPDLSAVPAAESSVPGIATPRWVVEEVEVAQADLAVPLHQQIQQQGHTETAPAGAVLETSPKQERGVASHDSQSAVDPSTAPVTENPAADASQPVAPSAASMVREVAVDSGRISSIVEQLLERLKPEVIAAVTRELEKKQ